MTDQPFFTVCTPTYNRGSILHRVYDSLEQQSCRDFEWLVVDDGSTDDTRARVEAWQAQASFPIRYVWQRNGHKKAAFNHGVREARGRMFLCADSDDALTPDALFLFKTHWERIPADQRPEFAGLRGLCIYPSGDIVGTKFPAEVFDASYLEATHRYRVQGEKWSCDRTDLLRAHPFPEDIDGYVPEGLVWAALARRYHTRMINRVVRVYFQSANSIIDTPGWVTASRHAMGMAIWTTDSLTHDLRWFRHDPTTFLRRAADHTRFVLHLKRSQRRSIAPLTGWSRQLVYMMAPVGLALYVRDRFHLRRARMRAGRGRD